MSDSQYVDPVMLREFIHEVQTHIGSSSKVTSRELLIEMGRLETAKNHVQIRRCAHAVRAGKYLPLCSNPGGYWIAGSSEELDECIKSLEHRISAVSGAIIGLKYLRANGVWT